MDGYKYITTPIDGEIIKINSMIKQEGINYVLGIRIIIKEYLKRTVSEKYHIVMNSFKIKIELHDGETDIQLLGKDTYWEYKYSLKNQLNGFDDILYQIDNISKNNTDINIKDDIINTYNKLSGLKEEKCDLINKRFCYSEQENDMVIAKLGTIDEVIETLKTIDIIIPEKIIGGITKQIS